MDESFDPLKCNEDLSSSPGCHMDYGKVPETVHLEDIVFSCVVFQSHCGPPLR